MSSFVNPGNAAIPSADNVKGMSQSSMTTVSGSNVAVAESELPATLDQCLQKRRHQNLLTSSLCGYAGCQDHTLAEEVALLDRLARVEPDANSDGFGRVVGVVGGEGLLYSDGRL